MYFIYNFSLSQVMILRNHGIVIWGETIEEVFSMAQNAVKACSFQVNTFISLYLLCTLCKSLLKLSALLQQHRTLQQTNQSSARIVEPSTIFKKVATERELTVAG